MNKPTIKLDSTYDKLKSKTINIRETQNITIKPDYDLLNTLRKQARLNPTSNQRNELKKQFENEYKGIMHTSIAALAEQCHTCSKTHGFQSNWLNVPEKLMLIVSELAEAMEAYRHIDPRLLTTLANTPPKEKVTLPEELADSVKQMHNFQEEMADTLIRLLDLMHALDIDIESTTANKMAINELRQHKHSKYC